ncbi:nuclear transport factor 2 family protein [Herbiconiux sp. A18JL235]|uniref:Nuclear transport factor 2 family protein n=1 Tax=Herbiconiux sp. A18JL235 TaxID=3152363 RepID=A0AB39BCR3_9MICO
MTASIEQLMHANLLEVFAEKDFDRRAEAIARTYTEGVVFTDPDEVVVGRDALNAKAQALADQSPDFEFSPAGPVYVNHDLGYLAWNLGPAGQPPVVKGIDICFAENGLIAKIYTLLTE